MVQNETGRRATPKGPKRSVRAHRRVGAVTGAEQAVAFAVAVLLPLYLAFRDGGQTLLVREQFTLVLWWGLALAFVFGVLPRARLDLRALQSLIVFVGLLAWTACSLLWTQSDERSITEFSRLLTLVGIVALPLVAINGTNWTAAATGLAVAVMAVPAISVLTRVLPEAFPAANLYEVDRLAYPLGYWNALAAWSAMAIAIGLSLSVHLRGPGLRGLALAFVAVAGTALYLTYSRGGIIATAVCVVAVAALSGNRRRVALHAGVATLAVGLVVLVVRSLPEIAEGAGSGGAGWFALTLVAAAGLCAATAVLTGRRRQYSEVRRGKRSATAAAVACLVVAVGGVAAVRMSPAAPAESPVGAAQPRLSEDYDPAARLVMLDSRRGAVWESALDAFRADPLTGIGPGTFDLWWSQDPEASKGVRDAHSLYLETLAELGVPGLLLLIGFLASLAASAFRVQRLARRSATLALTTGLAAAFFAFLFSAAIDWMWESTAVAAVALGGAALATAAPAKPKSPRRVRHPARIALAAVAIAAGAVQIPGIVSASRVEASENALLAGEAGTSFERASDAIRATPWAATPYAQRARVGLETGRVEGARRDARKAIEREPTHWRHWLLLAEIDGRRGDAMSVERDLDRAATLRPALADALRDLKERFLAEPSR